MLNPSSLDDSDPSSSLPQTSPHHPVQCVLHFSSSAPIAGWLLFSHEQTGESHLPNFCCRCFPPFCLLLLRSAQPPANRAPATQASGAFGWTVGEGACGRRGATNNKIGPCGGLILSGLGGNVADMSRHVSDDTTCRSNFGQMGPCRRHKIEDVVAVCVGSSRHLPDFPKCECRNILWCGSTYA